ncbi:TonB-dependent receptor [Bowmanella dokdonensis]|uniref:TonB-dependent receptor n=1 Tax=Bowmanella dokdonensis TaxID=751969 RepID=A0A939IR68_9ALTE|nr:TonB-dependent receptor [Bowmanella dokdonensis]MBN7825332.1 TonB-dependent receptor [Bowmanella dokdonensis]
MDRKFLLTALGWALVGLLLGIYMASTKNHGQMVTHAHVMLLGFVVSFVYAVMHKIWLHQPSARLANWQYYLHQSGSLGLFIGLFLMYGGHAPGAVAGPVLGISSILVLISLVMMKVLYIQAGREEKDK